MAKKRTVDVSAEVETLPENFRRKIPMTDVKQVSPAELRGNIKNKEYFGQESEQERQHLREDIRRRGIIVPLIAKRDGTLLAGHNRWLLAQELKLKYVPVQYVQEELTDEREREFIVKDNLLRRQLSAEKRMSLYQMLYPDFEETYLNPTTRSVGGRTKNTDSKRLTIARIAEETGQKENTVKKQIKDVRKKRGYQVPPFTKNVQSNELNAKRGYQVPPLENKDRTVQQPSIVKAARQIAKDLAQATDKEKKEVLAIFRKVLNAKTI